ncbi:MAG: hypothetical protein K6U77_09545 [Armatimonadetes bacterium]|nr:hypothetical protein [Armatimonadota bacterium]
MLTRYALIDPVLRALGWDTEDPAIVVPEYITQTGRIDYVLFWNNQKYIALEAKALGGDLPGARDTGFQYCWYNKIPFYLISDGDTWELHDMSVQGGLRVFNVRITQPPLGQVAYDLLRLHREFMPLQAKSGSAVASSTAATGPHTHPAVSHGSSSTTSVPPFVPPSVSLKDLHHQGYPVTGKRPRKVVFPDGSSQNLSTWKDFLIETIKYLDNLQTLPPPPRSWGKRGSSYLYNTAPTHPGGNPMRQPVSVNTSQHGTIYVETHGSARYLCQAVYELIIATGINPEDITLDFV